MRRSADKLREGVPQGGVVSPTLFLVYINDITTTVPRHVSNTLHADDFAVRCAEEHTTTAVHRIQNTINEVCSWTESWALQLNTTKTVSTLFTLSTAKEKVSLRWNNLPVPQVETSTFLGVTLDTRLTWKPHLEAVEAKATRKLAIMKKLAGTTWGANSNILKQVSTGAVGPVIEYASTTWDTASKTNKSKLDRVQNMGLRITLGAMRSTPIQQMEKTTELQPLECRREYKAAIQGEKLKRLTSHPLHQKLQHGTKNCLKRKSFKQKLKDLQKENADLLEADPGKCEELTMSVWASRKSLPEVRTEIPGLAAKGRKAPELQKALTLEMIQSRYPKSTWTHVFTDGSAENAVRNGGSGAYIRRSDGTTSSLSIPAGCLSSNYRAEVHALKAATELLIAEDCNQQNIVFLSDSVCSSVSDKWPHRLSHPAATQQPAYSVRQQHSSAPVGASTCWHCWNETADRLAKAAAKLPQPYFSTTYREVKTLLKQKQKSAWRLKNNEYDPQKDHINTLDRRTQTTIFRLRTGHCGLRKHLKRLGLADSAHCECGSDEQTPEHIFQTCPHLETVHQQFWPEDIEVGTKLWGQAAELQRTADFLAATGLRI